MSVLEALALEDVRPMVAQILAPTATDDLEVHIDYPDSVEPPALVIVWADPWLEQPVAMGPCELIANMDVLCVGSRIEPGPGIDQVERLVVYTIDRMRSDVHRWPLRTSQQPREWIIGGPHYLAARLGYRVPVNV